MPAPQPPQRKLTIPPPCDITLGLVCVDKSTPGTTVWEMPAEERFANPAGFVQGGIVAALADTAMAAASITANSGRKVFTANTDLHISFLRPAGVGGKLICTARAVSNGKRVCFLEAEVTDGEGTVVARASSTYLLTPRDDN